MVSSTSEKTASIVLGWLCDSGLTGFLSQNRINDLSCPAVLRALENVVLDQRDGQLQLAHALAGLGNFDWHSDAALFDFPRVRLTDRDDETGWYWINVPLKVRAEVAPGQPPLHRTVDTIFAFEGCNTRLPTGFDQQHSSEVLARHVVGQTIGNVVYVQLTFVGMITERLEATDQNVLVGPLVRQLDGRSWRRLVHEGIAQRMDQHFAIGIAQALPEQHALRGGVGIAEQQAPPQVRRGRHRLVLRKTRERVAHDDTWLPVAHCLKHSYLTCRVCGMGHCVLFSRRERVTSRVAGRAVRVTYSAHLFKGRDGRVGMDSSTQVTVAMAGAQGTNASSGLVAPARVLIADNSDSCTRPLERAFVAKGYSVQICAHGAVVKQLVSECPPNLLITEVRLANGLVLKLIEWIKAEYPAVRVVVHTNHASIATAIRCARLGVDAYFPKPVPFEQLLSFSRESCTSAAGEQQNEPLPLDRAMWEYMHRVVESAGTIAQAARLLGEDRRSLRRILGKHAPPS